jgi:hypothetical protein
MRLIPRIVKCGLVPVNAQTANAINSSPHADSRMEFLRSDVVPLPHIAWTIELVEFTLVIEPFIKRELSPISIFGQVISSANLQGQPEPSCVVNRRWWHFPQPWRAYFAGRRYRSTIGAERHRQYVALMSHRLSARLSRSRIPQLRGLIATPRNHAL